MNKWMMMLMVAGLSVAAWAEPKVPEIQIKPPKLDAEKVFEVPAPSEGDDWPVVKAMLEKAMAAGPGAKLLFHPGRYDLSAHPHLKPATTGGSIIHADVEDSTPDLSGAHLFLKNVTDLEIDGQGATLLMHPSNTFLEMDGCERVQVKNFTLNYTMPHHMQGDIVEVADDFSSFVVKPHTGYPYSAGFPEANVELSQAVMVLQSDRNEMKYREELGTDHLFVSFEIDKEAHLIRYRVAPNYQKVIQSLNVGERVVSLANYGSTLENMLVVRSRDCLLENITSHSGGDMNIRPANNEGPLVFRRITNIPKPGSNNIVATIKDGIHCRSNRGPILIEQCTFHNMMDDSINIFVLGSVCNEITEDGALKVGRDDYGEPWDFYRPGDTIAFLDQQAGAYLAKLTLKSVVRQHADKDRLNHYYTLRFEEPLPDNLVLGKKGDPAATQIYNLNACGAGSVIRNNVFKKQRRHALFVSAPNCAFVNNIVDGVSGSAVCGSTQGHYVCGPLPEGLIIRGNAIRNTGWEAIKLSTGITPRPDVEHSPMHRILIEDNDIQLKRNAGIHLSNCRDVQIKNNTITVLPGASARAKPITITNCLRVEQSGNEMVGNE